MKRTLLYTTFCLWTWCLGSHAASDSYYTLFLSQLETKMEPEFMPYGGYKIPLLVDATNIAPKFTKSRLSELKVSPQLALAGIQLGMKMDEVVGAWGKPRRVSLYRGAPTLIYQDSREAYDEYASTYAFFSPGSNSVMAIWVLFQWVSDRPRLSPMADECLRVLGEPFARNYVPDPFEPRKTPPKHWYCRMVYKRPPLVLYFADGLLMALEINPQAKGVAREGQGTDEFSIQFCLE